MINIAEIIDEAPRLLQYFISGFIFLKIFCFLNSKDNYGASFFTIWSVIVSFIIINVVKIFDSIIFPKNTLLPWSEVMICILIATILAFAVHRLSRSKFLSQFLSDTTRKSINSDIWRDIIDYEKGTTLKIFLKNQSIIYIGKLMIHEEKGLGSWFALKDYICMYPNKNEEFDSTTCPNPSIVAINLNEIERIELFYNKDTKILD